MKGFADESGVIVTIEKERTAAGLLPELPILLSHDKQLQQLFFTQTESETKGDMIRNEAIILVEGVSMVRIKV